MRTIFGIEWQKNEKLQDLHFLMIGSAYCPLETINSIDLIYETMETLIRTGDAIDTENKVRKWKTYIDFYYKDHGPYKWANWNYYHLVNSKPGAISTTNGSEGSV